MLCTYMPNNFFLCLQVKNKPYQHVENMHFFLKYGAVQYSKFFTY